nr:MAG TPA: hypothetical protein [Caudoviricetes sp.]
MSILPIALFIMLLSLIILIRLRRNTPCFSYGDIRRLCLTSSYASL